VSDEVQVALEALSIETSQERLFEIIESYGGEWALIAAANPVLKAEVLEDLAAQIDEQLWSMHPDDSYSYEDIWILSGIACNPNLTNEIKNKLLDHQNPVALIRFFDQMSKAEQDELPISRDPVLRFFFGQELAYEMLVTEAQSRTTKSDRLVEIFDLGLRELVDREDFFGDYEWYVGLRDRGIFTQFLFFDFDAGLFRSGDVDETLVKGLEKNPVLVEVAKYFSATENNPEFTNLGSIALSNPNYPIVRMDNLVRNSHSACFWSDYLKYEYHPSLFHFIEHVNSTGYEIDTQWWLAISRAICAMDTEEQLDQVVEVLGSTALVGWDDICIDDQFDEYVAMIMPFLVGSSQNFLEKSFELDSNAIKRAILLNPSCTINIRKRAMEMDTADLGDESLSIPSPVQLAIYAAHLGKYDLIENWITTPEDIDSFIGFCDPYIIDAISGIEFISKHSSTKVGFVC